MKCFQPRTKALPTPKPGDEFGKRLVQTISEMESDRMNSTVFGLNTDSTANYVPGVNAGNTRWEYKNIVGGTGVTVTHTPNTITLTNTGIGSLNHSALSNLTYATAGHTGFEPTVTKGNLTEATSGVLTISGGTGAVVGSGTSIQVKLAGAAQSGYLSSGDWSTFNAKEPALSAGTTAQYYRGDKTWQTLNQAAVDGLTTASTPNFTGVHATTALVDHIGEHTGAHTVVFDSTVTLPATVALSAATTVSGAQSIDLSSYNMIYLPPGTGFAAAVSAMNNGDCLVLGAGTYTVDGASGTLDTDVTRFAIIGQGPGVTRIDVASNHSAIISQTGAPTDAQRVQQAFISGLSINFTYPTADSTTAYGIYLWGDDTNSAVEQRIVIQNVNISYGAPNYYFFNAGICLVNAFNPVISNVYIRCSAQHQSMGNATDGIWLQSCQQAQLSNIRIVGADRAIDLQKAADNLIRSATKHGCEMVCLSQVHAYMCGYGLVLGIKCYVTQVSNCEFAVCQHGHIYEEGFASDAGVGGYHRIMGSYMDCNNASTTADMNMIYLTRPGTQVIGNMLDAYTYDVNAITLDHTTADARCDLCVISNNVIRNIKTGHSGIYLYGADNNMISHNMFDTCAGNDIYLDANTSGNLVDYNMYDNAVTDAAANTLDGNLAH
jgi:hypothetical protein